jgi:2-oxo-4-hydroxy-4-carboxy--5-ureidoimidazoline (OHCU) decarboxylase
MEVSHRMIEIIDKLERKQRNELINKHLSLCIKYLNDNHNSLGIVKPLLIKAYFEDRDEHDTQKFIQHCLAILSSGPWMSTRKKPTYYFAIY